MPPSPDFCYYEALELTKAATQLEITTSYRKLALQHHPDRNPGNPNATANFQKIQAAHETLSDPEKRVIYDDHNAGVSQTNGGYSRYDSSDDDLSDYGFNFYSFGERAFFFSTAPRFPPPAPTFEEMKTRFMAEELSKLSPMEQTMKEYRAKQKKLEDLRNEKEEAKRAAEEMKKTAFNDREKGEREAQIMRWNAANVTTEAEKQETCLHSEFWTKVQQKKKFKCGPCGKKRGMVSFKCPHCALLACQVCLDDFSTNRRRDNGQN